MADTQVIDEIGTEVAVQDASVSAIAQREEPIDLMGALIQAAMNESVDPDKMDRLFQMHERVEKRQAEKAFAGAMAQMQPRLPAVEKGGQNKHLGSNYSRLEDIQRAIRPLLSEYGFSVAWSSQTIDGQIHVTCTVTHCDGHSRSDTLPLPVMEGNKGVNQLQSHGITMSYGKRYTLCNVLGIQLGGEDNDGNAPRELLGPEEMTVLDALLTETKTDRKTFFEYMRVEGMSDIPLTAFEGAKKMLEMKKQKMTEGSAQ